MTASTLGLPLDRERALLPQLRESRPAEPAAVVAASVLLGCILAATGDWTAFALLGTVVFVALGALRPALFLMLVLLVRPVLDQVSDVTLGVRSANLGGALAIMLIFTTALAGIRWRKVTWPAAAAVMFIALAVSAVSGVQAALKLGSSAGLEALAEVVRVAALFAVYVLAANLFGTPAASRRLFVIVGLSGVVPGLLGIAEWISGPPLAEGLGLPRISGPFTGPVAFGLFLAVPALILVFLPRDQLRPPVRIAALLAVLPALVGSLSRAGWIVFVAGIVLLGWRARKPLVVGVAVVLTVLIVSVPAVRDRTLPVSESATSAPVANTYSSWYWRTENWGGLLDQWRKDPIFGYGIRATRYVNERTPFATRGQPAGGFDAHNLIVRLLVEGGVILLAAYLAFFAVLLRSMWRLARSPWELQGLGKLLLGIWGLLLFVGMTTDDPFAGTAVMISLLALTGSLDAAHRDWQRRRGEVRGAPSADAQPVR